MTIMDNKNTIILTTVFSIRTLSEELSSSSSGDSSCSEDELVIVLKQASKKAKLYDKRKPVRFQLYLERVVTNYSAQEFQSHFRISRIAFEHVLSFVGISLKRQTRVGRCTIDIERQLLSVIWILATPDSYRSIGERFGMGKASLSVSFTRVIKALCELSPTLIKWPSGHRSREVERKFFEMARIEKIVGAIDGTYITIKAPTVDKEVYITRKCNYAITLQAVCDSFLKYTDIFVGYPGSVSDTRIFRNSDLFKKVQRNHELYFPNNQFIIGDKAYPVLNWCIPPYIDNGHMTEAQIYFNNMLSKTRQTIERSFALLFGRFRRLKYLDMNRTDFIPATVLACCILHNICLSEEDSLIEDYIIEGSVRDQHNEDNELGNQGQAPEGPGRRNEMCRTLFQAHRRRHPEN